MKTDDLIRLMAADARSGPALNRRLMLALVAGGTVSAALLLVTVGLRPGILGLIGEPRVTFKIVEMAMILLAVLPLLLNAGRPEDRAARRAWPLLLPLGALVPAIGLELLAVPAADWGTRLVGAHALFCLFFIPVLSLAPLAGLMAALKHGAPADPRLAGAAAGLAAGSLAAALYAWHCPDDSPLFAATWYMLAMAAVTAVGAGLGQRLLRW